MKIPFGAFASKACVQTAFAVSFREGNYLLDDVWAISINQRFLMSQMFKGIKIDLAGLK